MHNTQNTSTRTSLYSMCSQSIYVCVYDWAGQWHCHMALFWRAFSPTGSVWRYTNGKRDIDLTDCHWSGQHIHTSVSYKQNNTIPRYISNKYLIWCADDLYWKAKSTTACEQRQTVGHECMQHCTQEQWKTDNSGWLENAHLFIDDSISLLGIARERERKKMHFPLAFVFVILCTQGLWLGNGIYFE